VQHGARGSKRNVERDLRSGALRIPTPSRTICIDWSTGQICASEPIEHGGQVIPFTASRSGLRGKNK